MFEFRKPFVLAMIAASLGLGLTACGDDDKSGDSAQSAAADTTAAQTETASAADSSDSAKRDGAKADGADASGSDRDGSTADSGDSSGGGSGSGSRGAAGSGGGSDVPSGGKVLGDGSIQRFGESAGSGDRDAIVAAANGFYSARAASDWPRFCELLSTAISKQLQQMLEQAPQMKGKPKGCANVVAALVGGVPQASRAADADGISFTEVRVDGDSAFAIFKSGTIPNGFLPMTREGGVWKVGAVGGSSF